MEIERRWLVNGWPELEHTAVVYMDQGYFAVRPAVRVRREAAAGCPCLSGRRARNCCCSAAVRPSPTTPSQ